LGRLAGEFGRRVRRPSSISDRAADRENARCRAPCPIRESAVDVRRASRCGPRIRSVDAVRVPHRRNEHVSGAVGTTKGVCSWRGAISGAAGSWLVITACVLWRVHRPRPLRRAARRACRNDASLELLARTAVSQARVAFADLVAPSTYDGRVTREIPLRALRARASHIPPILAYSAKFASPSTARSEAPLVPSCGDRRGYQMDPHGEERCARRLLELWQRGRTW